MQMIRVGIIGTGFIVKQALAVLWRRQASTSALRLDVSKVLTRRPTHSVADIPEELLTNNVDELLEHSDIVFESTGDAVHGTETVERALLAGKKVLTMNAELHVTTGSYLQKLGYLTEADGDQPGSLALLRREAVEMGFTPMAYVNIKGYLNHNPSREDMEYWSKRQKLSLVETTSFTDGTKLQIEQTFAANAFGATIATDGLLGGQVDDIYDTDHFVEKAHALGAPLSDYVQCSTAPPGVFILAEHPVSETHRHYGPYEKLRTKGGEAYLLLRPYHLCGLEVPKSLLKVAKGEPPLMTNGDLPRVSVAAIAKHDLKPGVILDHAIGGFDVRGSAVVSATSPDHVPIGLMKGARIKRPVGAGQTVCFDDVELPASRALEIWQQELRPLVTGNQVARSAPQPNLTERRYRGPRQSETPSSPPSSS